MSNVELAHNHSAKGTAGTLRAALRLHTASAHTALERTPLMEQLANGKPSLGLYCDYLQRQLRVHLALEAPLRSWMPAPWVHLHLHKSDWLRSDLAAMGTEPDTRVLGAPAIASHAEAMGVIYVLEGSTLGLQVVQKRLVPSHPAACAAGRFIRGYGQHTGMYWKAFIDMLEGVSRQHWDGVLESADATFRTFHQVFCEPCIESPAYDAAHC